LPARAGIALAGFIHAGANTLFQVFMYGHR
jgi:hypothetical protein